MIACDCSLIVALRKHNMQKTLSSRSNRSWNCSSSARSDWTCLITYYSCTVAHATKCVHRVFFNSRAFTFAPPMFHVLWDPFRQMFGKVRVQHDTCPVIENLTFLNLFLQCKFGVWSEDWTTEMSLLCFQSTFSFLGPRFSPGWHTQRVHRLVGFCVDHRSISSCVGFLAGISWLSHKQAEL